MLAYETKRLLPTCSTVLVAFSWSFAAVVYDGLSLSHFQVLFGAAIMNVLMIAGSTFAGKAFKWKELARKSVLLDLALRGKQEQLERQRRKVRISSTMHDTLTGVMADIELLSEQALIEDGRSPEREETLRHIQKKSQAANAALHAVIRMIRDEDSNLQETYLSDIDSTSTLSRVLRRQDDRLRLLGFTGVGIVDGTSSHVPKSTVHLVCDLLHEIYNNIVKHCDPSSREYRIVVSLSHSRIDILESNPAGSDPQIGGQGGIGLASFAQKLQRCGGSIRSNSEEGCWTLHVVVPLVLRLDQTSGNDQ